jgi:hypothetical protein
VAQPAKARAAAKQPMRAVDNPANTMLMTFSLIL